MAAREVLGEAELQPPRAVTITTKDLVGDISTATGCQRSVVNEIVTSLLDGMVSELTTGNKVRLTGFGTFQIRDMDERVARNPRTGATLTIPATKKLAFRVAKELKSEIAE